MPYITETFKYWVENSEDYMSAAYILDLVAGMPCPIWDGMENLPKNPETKEEEYQPFGESVLTVD